MVPLHSRSAWIWSVVVAGASALALFATRSLVKTSGAAPTQSLAAVQPVAAADVPVPPFAESDARLRDALSGVSPRELFHRWLKADHLLDRLAVVTVNLAEDESPRAQLSFLRPDRPFKAAHGAISPSSYGRYDPFANVISSLDERRVAATYRTLHPLLESAYHALGYPGRPLDGAVTRALQRIASAPVREDVAVHRVGSLWLYTDARLESLGPVEKQLLRMGPRNTRLLQQTAREIAGALGFSLKASPVADSR
ncbi:MAG: DUF3014 domain-containing protein [Myxococcales bacterium]|nr:DUF3014 domain-containing protein [Myxococcales bacterium]